MNERKRFLYLILIMTCVSLTVGGIAIILLYRAAIDESRQRLVETAQSQARLIEAVARFDRVWSMDYPEGWVSATLGQISDSHERYKGFGETGEFTLARRDEGNIVFLLSHRHGELGSPQPVPFESELAEPMRRALLGQSGTVIGLDYRGAEVVAAHEPVAELNLGIVAKIDIAEVRAPFIKAGLFAGASALLVILFGSVLFIRTSNPILVRLQHLYEKSQDELAERKRAEGALEESEQRFRQLAENIQDVFWLGTPDWNEVIYVSPAYEELWGRTRESLYREPRSWLDGIAEQDKERVKEAIDRKSAGEMSDAEFPEYRVVRPDGSICWVLSRAFPIRDEGGDIYRVAGIAEDITDRKLAEEVLRNVNEQLEQRVQERTAELIAANDRLSKEIEDRKQTEQSLQDSEATFRAVFDSAPVMMLLLDSDREVRKMNPAASRMLGKKDQQQLGIRFGNAVGCVYSHDDPRGCGCGPRCGSCPVRLLVSDTYETGQTTHSQEIKLSRAEGKSHNEAWFLASTCVPDLPKRREVLLCLEDITERKRTEEQIRTNLEVQKATAEILRMSLKPSSVEEFLLQVLDFLLSIRWIAVESKGMIFLAEEDSDTLVMKAQRGLSQHLVASCARVPSGKCLCGRAASTREIVFADSVDERHELHYPGMTPHGHYCVPITSNERLYGVISLYVAEGHQRKPEEALFLSSVASILATTIEKKQAEEALRKSEERFDLAVRGTDAGIWDWDLETNRVYFSPRWKSMLGHEEEEIPNDFSQWEDRLHPEERSCALDTIHDYLEGKTASYELEHRLRHKDGSYRWILSRGALVRDPHGMPNRMVGSHIDITKLKEAEKALLEQETQLRVAQRIQEHLLPDKPPVLPGFDIAGASHPAEFAAGDHYDYLEMFDGSMGVVIGDVSGHGFGPAILMASLCARLRSLAETDLPIDEILTRTNLALTGEVAEGRFITAILARLGPTSRSLSYVNAGHPSGYVVDRCGDVKAQMESTGLPLAILPDADFPVGDSIKLDPGDIVILLTDGVLEASSADGELFEMDRVLEVVRRNLDETASEMIELIRQAVREFTGGEQLLDDFTVVLMKVSDT